MRLRASLLCGVLIVSGLPTAVVPAALVLPGFDLLETTPGLTNFQGIPFQGVPLGSYDFGGSIGTQAVGNTDTIVQRNGTVDTSPNPTGSGTIPIEMLALQLVSVAPINMGAGLDFHYLTLQSTRSGPATTGQMTIDILNPLPTPDPIEGTFTSFFDVFYDIRIGSLSGPIVISNATPLHLTSLTPTQWGRDPSPPTAVQIPGVNVKLNGSDNNADFWPIGSITEQEPGATHTVTNATFSAVPEARPLVVLSALTIAVAIVAWLRSHLRLLATPK